MRPLSTEENNSGCVVYYQLGQLGIGPGRAALLLLLRLIHQPLFAELRTSQQLGYVVHSAELTSGGGHARVSGAYVLILSKDHPPPRLQKAIDAYLARLADDVVGTLSDDDFRTARSALVARYREPDRTLAEAFQRRWAAIDEELYDWERRAKLADALEAVTREEVHELARRLATFPRLSVHVFGNRHLDAFDEDDGSASAPIDSWETWRESQEVWA